MRLVLAGGAGVGWNRTSRGEAVVARALDAEGRTHDVFATRDSDATETRKRPVLIRRTWGRMCRPA